MPWLGGHQGAADGVARVGAAAATLLRRILKPRRRRRRCTSWPGCQCARPPSPANASQVYERIYAFAATALGYEPGRSTQEVALDIGCGPGSVAIQLANKYAQVSVFILIN